MRTDDYLRHRLPALLQAGKGLDKCWMIAAQIGKDILHAQAGGQLEQTLRGARLILVLCHSALPQSNFVLPVLIIRSSTGYWHLFARPGQIVQRRKPVAG
jgi:hypothetical protein